MSIKVTETEVKLISVVVPSVNGNAAKLLAISTEQYSKLLNASATNVQNAEGDITSPIYALFVDSDLSHNLITTGNTGGVVRSQFNEILRDVYNAKLQYNESGNQMVDA